MCCRIQGSFHLRLLGDKDDIVVVFEKKWPFFGEGFEKKNLQGLVFSSLLRSENKKTERLCNIEICVNSQIMHLEFLRNDTILPIETRRIPSYSQTCSQQLLDSQGILCELRVGWGGRVPWGWVPWRSLHPETIPPTSFVRPSNREKTQFLASQSGKKSDGLKKYAFWYLYI